MLTQSELNRFHQFARAMVEDGGVESLEECVRMWEEQETLAALREAQADIAAGRTKPARQVEAELRAEFGLRPRASAK